MRKRDILKWIITVAIGIVLISIPLEHTIFGDQPLNIYYFTIVHFAGYLFFLLLPVETLVPIYLSAGFNPVLIFFISIVTATIAQIIDYSVGYSVSEAVINKMVGAWRYRRFEKLIGKYGSITIFVFNLFPLSSSVISLIAGTLRFNFKKTVFFSILGLSIKYLIIILSFYLFS